MTTPTDIIRQAINFQLSNVNTCLPARIETYESSEKKAKQGTSAIIAKWNIQPGRDTHARILCYMPGMQEQELS